MPQVIGHNRQREALSRLIVRDRLPGSLLFSGIPGIGKHCVALELAKQLLCQHQESQPGGCGECHSCTLFDANNHPDLHRITFASENGASVDELRAMLERLSLKAFLGGRKVAIIDEADYLSVVGANVVLKSLEEPRPGCYFILVLSNPSRLPPTLVSRCQRWFFDRLSDIELKKILTLRGVTDVSLETLALADGSVTEIDSLREQQPLLEDVRHTVGAAFGGEEHVIARAAQAWGAEKDLLRPRLTFLRMVIHKRLLESASDSLAAAVWAHALQNVLDAEYLIIDRHVNPTSCLHGLLSSCRRSLGKRLTATPSIQLGLWESVQA